MIRRICRENPTWGAPQIQSELRLLGYQSYFPAVAWAVVVDAVTVSTVIWVISGVWLLVWLDSKRLPLYNAAKN